MASLSVETRAKMSAAALGKPKPWVSAALKGKAPFAGKRHSAETRARMSKARVAFMVSGRGKKSDTRPEQLVGSALGKIGLAYEAQAKIPGCNKHVWDFVLTAQKLLIEVDGCYWHGCSHCGCAGKPTNIAADESKLAVAEKLGWRLVRLPSCLLKADGLADRIEQRVWT